MDEISVFTALQPEAPEELAAIREAVRTRLHSELDAGAPAAPRRRLRKRTLVMMAGGLVAAAVAVVAVVVIPAALPGAAPGARAWAVERNSDGTVTVSVNQEFTDPAGLQRALRAAGVFAFVRVISLSVNAAGHTSVSVGCNLGPQQAPASVQRAVVSSDLSGQGTGTQQSWIIKLSAMPSGSALFLLSFQGSAFSAVMTPQVLKTEQAPKCLPG